MNLEMKIGCERCGRNLPSTAEAFICSYECTFCPSCTAQFQGTCPNCGGELTQRPRRASVEVTALGNKPRTSLRAWALAWVLSFGIWGFVTAAGTASIYELYRSTGKHMSLLSTLALESSQLIAYAPLTPFVFFLAIRYPLRRWNWKGSSIAYLGGGILFCIAHILLRGLTPFGVWSSQTNDWISLFWNSYSVGIKMKLLREMFLRNVIDDITGVYVPIVFIGHAVGYYHKLRERERQTSQLEGQLSKARLQALRNQLHPHFLFNAMHSISALMLIDVHAADKAMTRLSDLLRMTLETNESQVTTLGRELEFVNAYLEIERVRFADRLTVHCDIAPDTLDAQVPHLLLQPIVENAIRHGIARRIESGELRITTRHAGGQMLLTVGDNGPGFPEGPPLHEGVGLRTTRERLRTLYGEDQSVSIRSAPEEGLAVTIRIPFRMDKRPLLYDINTVDSR